MNENNTNTNIENEEVKNVIYSSSYVIGAIVSIIIDIKMQTPGMFML